MKNLLFIFLLLPLLACQDKSTEESAPVIVPDLSEAAKTSQYAGFDTDRDALAYALGADQGQGLLRRAKYLKTIGVDLSNEMTLQGFLDAFDDADKSDEDPKAVKLDMEQMKNLIYGLSREQQKLEQALAQKESQEQAAKGKIFLNEYKNKKGVQTTASGLLYRVLASGSGAKPKFEDTILAHYKGTYIDGRVFDSSRSRGDEPTKFMVSAVIAGWSEALQMMSVGDTWEVIVPPSLGYGESRHGDIPANSVLIFEIELISIVPQK